MKLSTILKKARKRIYSKKNLYICYAIRNIVFKHNSATLEQKNYLGKWIRCQLGSVYFYETWMLHNYPKKARKMVEADFRAGRLAWLDWMIAELKKTGE